MIILFRSLLRLVSYLFWKEFSLCLLFLIAAILQWHRTQNGVIFGCQIKMTSFPVVKFKMASFPVAKIKIESFPVAKIQISSLPVDNYEMASFPVTKFEMA